MNHDQSNFDTWIIVSKMNSLPSSHFEHIMSQNGITVVLYMDLIKNAVLNSSNINSLSKMDLMEGWSKSSQCFIKLSNFSKHNVIFLFLPFNDVLGIFFMTSKSFENNFFILPKLAANRSVCVSGLFGWGITNIMILN